MVKTTFNKFFTKQNIDLGLAALAFFLGIYQGWSFGFIATFTVLIYSILKELGSNFYLKIAISLFVMAAIAYFVQRPLISEEIASNAFIFLLVFLILAVLEYRKKNI